MTSEKSKNDNTKLLLICLIWAVGFAYYFSNPKPQEYYDYTFRVADNILRGEIAFKEKPPTWLNEFVPFEENYYSVFPLGSIITMMPFAFLKLIGVIGDMPASFISALTASAICLFLLLISKKYELEWKKRILFTLVILFGTWMWTNETMAGAWQLALGWAMLGEIGAIYFTLYDRRPFLAGLFFALAFGNRTEILLTAPIFMFLLFYDKQSNKQILEEEILEETVKTKSKTKKKKAEQKIETEKTLRQNLKSAISNFKFQISNDTKKSFIKLAKFCAVPLTLGVLTLIYNYVRFHSFTDFGYARIPGVLDEPWYSHGIFSVYYIPGQAYEMLFKPWESFANFPYLLPEPFSSSILWSSPFLLLLFRTGVRDKLLVLSAWIAIFILTILLWMHGNSGGWQFGYRYAMVLLPWIFVILVENKSKNITLFEAVTCALSFLINIYAVYIFHWTEYMKR